MRQFLPTLFAILAAAAPVSAQSATEQIWLSLSSGVQLTSAFNDAFHLTLYTEPEPVTVDYGAHNGFYISASGGYRLWHQLFVGAGVTHYSAAAHPRVAAQLPHPFFDNTYRPVEGNAPMLLSEVGAHALLGWIWRPTSTMRVMLTAGPSYISARYPIVTEVTFTEAYPYDTAEFTGVKTTDSSRGAAGFNAGADVFWMFAKHIGAGGLVQVTHARVTAPIDARRSVSFDAGGTQIGVGLRFLF